MSNVTHQPKIGFVSWAARNIKKRLRLLNEQLKLSIEIDRKRGCIASFFLTSHPLGEWIFSMGVSIPDLSIWSMNNQFTFLIAGD
ncbi:hypothetical protein IUJ34_04130 [Klebsiella pneumoniae subsp. pneumoniae]|uniref:Uncharacterized protein n=1 Tax=Klebsiella pneumoniae subsp. pneumoniae TaxID=72407 RepID=A0A7S9HFE9_KLEPN|nr:hypothetical protein IUJ34_04130 [Klebsiella pneumoniae subsp. pneumoniae]